MEPIFENVTIETEQIIKEALLFAHHKKLRRNKIFGAIFIVAFLGLGLVRDNVFLLAAAAFYAFWFAWQFICPGWAAKRAIKRKLAFYNQTNPPLTYRFLDDHFEVSDIDSWYSAPYDKIESATRLKSCIVVKVRDKGDFPISLDGFRKGTPEELIDFLRTKYTQPNPANWNW